jgi:uncharacterized RDD family membrane protein YckC
VRGPGEWLLGIRQVDASTGGPITLRSALIRQVAVRLSTDVINEITRPAIQRASQQARAIKPLLEEIRQRHAGDEQAIGRAVGELYAESDIRPFASCLWPPLAIVAANQLQVIFSRRRQTLPDRLAGIIVVKS